MEFVKNFTCIGIFIMNLTPQIIVNFVPFHLKNYVNVTKILGLLRYCFKFIQLTH